MSGWQTVTAAKIALARRIVILGVGSELKGDDAAGMRLIELLVAKPLPQERVLLLAGSTAPENFTGVIRDFAADLLLVVDAAHLDCEPGNIQPLQAGEIDGLGFSTHMLPLSVMLQYLAKQGLQETLLLGIQPATTEFGLALTPTVAEAVQGLASFLTRQLAE